MTEDIRLTHRNVASDSQNLVSWPSIAEMNSPYVYPADFTGEAECHCVDCKRRDWIDWEDLKRATRRLDWFGDALFRLYLTYYRLKRRLTR
jgi:hypothetical protein